MLSSGPFDPNEGNCKGGVEAGEGDEVVPGANKEGLEGDIGEACALVATVSAPPGKVDVVRLPVVVLFTLGSQFLRQLAFVHLFHNLTSSSPVTIDTVIG